MRKSKILRIKINEGTIYQYLWESGKVILKGKNYKFEYIYHKPKRNKN